MQFLWAVPSACVRAGDSLALSDSARNKVYPLEDNKQLREYAGQRVEITRSYDDDANVLLRPSTIGDETARETGGRVCEQHVRDVLVHGVVSGLHSPYASAKCCKLGI